MFLRKRFLLNRLQALMLVAAGLSSAPVHGDFPPLTTEISAEHPLFLFQDFRGANNTPAAYAAQLVTAWSGLYDGLRPYSALRLDNGNGDAVSQHQYYMDLLLPLQEANVPVTVRVANGDARPWYNPDRLGELLGTYTNIRGVEVAGLQFNDYGPAKGREAELPGHVSWLIEIIDVAARYGRFVYLPLDDIHWLRLMSNDNSAPLYRKLLQCRGYVIPASVQRGHGVIAQNSALMGLWLEEAVAFWGVAADGDWYPESGFIAPGVFGRTRDRFYHPGHPFRAMVYNGAMTGAAVYSFGPEESLWFGGQAEHWDEHIYPTLQEILHLSLIARKEFVLDKARIAYRLGTSSTPLDFDGALRDLDPVYGAGNMMAGVYGLERRGQIPELVLNRDGVFWIPIFSPYAPADLVNRFDQFIQPGVLPDRAAWSALAEPLRRRDGDGRAFIARIGRGVFVMNTRENTREAQDFYIPELPRPLEGLEAERDGTGITLRWPYREGDISYNVYRRVGGQQGFRLYAQGLEETRFTDGDAPGDLNVSYGVTALTSERASYSGVVGFGEYRAFSTVESRLVEEVLLTPVLSSARAQALPSSGDRETDDPWWPHYEGTPEDQMAVAEAIVARLEAWDTAFSSEDLDGVVGIYASDYEDPQGWRLQYVRRAYQWLFERYRAPHMHRQIRRWDFSAFEGTGEVSVLLYCRLVASSIADTTGRYSDGLVSLPRTETQEVWFTFAERNEAWRIVRTNPALPNFHDLLVYSASPYDGLVPGVDRFPAR